MAINSRYKLKTGEEVAYFPPIQNTIFIIYAIAVIGFVAYNILMNGIPEY